MRVNSPASGSREDSYWLTQWEKVHDLSIEKDIWSNILVMSAVRSAKQEFYQNIPYLTLSIW